MTDEPLTPVWIAFAGQFLDTETRDSIPLAALAAVEAGLSVEDARATWCLDVAPLVGGNLLSVAGEWEGWDEAWLLERIRARRSRKSGRLARLVGTYWWLTVSGDVWRAVAQCMGELLAVGPERRRTTATDLRGLAGYYFDFCKRPFDLSVPGRREELTRLFRSVFLPIFSRLVVESADESRALCEERVLQALGGRPERNASTLRR